MHDVDLKKILKDISKDCFPDEETAQRLKDSIIQALKAIKIIE